MNVGPESKRGFVFVDVNLYPLCKVSRKAMNRQRGTAGKNCFERDDHECEPKNDGSEEISTYGYCSRFL